MTGEVLKTSANTGQYPVSSYLTSLLLYVITCLGEWSFPSNSESSLSLLEEVE